MLLVPFVRFLYIPRIMSERSTMAFANGWRRFGSARGVRGTERTVERSTTSVCQVSVGWKTVQGRISLAGVFPKCEMGQSQDALRGALLARKDRVTTAPLPQTCLLSKKGLGRCRENITNSGAVLYLIRTPDYSTLYSTEFKRTVRRVP